MAITVKQFLMGRIAPIELSYEQSKNMGTLLIRVNQLLKQFGQDRAVTSGFRSPSDQARINPKATHSKHLICAAVDLEDKDKKLKEWCLANLPALEKLGLWLEDPSSTPTWAHLQCLPPASGNRVFKP